MNEQHKQKLEHLAGIAANLQQSWYTRALVNRKTYPQAARQASDCGLQASDVLHASLRAQIEPTRSDTAGILDC